MKTAVSIPDDIFERAERLASQQQRSRSEVYASALDQYLARNAPDEITDTMTAEGVFWGVSGQRVKSFNFLIHKHF